MTQLYIFKENTRIKQHFQPHWLENFSGGIVPVIKKLLQLLFPNGSLSGGLTKNKLLSPTHRCSRYWWGLRICLSNNFQLLLMLVGLGPHFETHTRFFFNQPLPTSFFLHLQIITILIWACYGLNQVPPVHIVEDLTPSSTPEWDCIW